MFIHTGYLISCCRNKIPETGWLKQQELIFLQFWSLGSRDQLWQHGWVPGEWMPSCCVLTWQRDRREKEGERRGERRDGDRMEHLACELSGLFLTTPPRGPCPPGLTKPPSLPEAPYLQIPSHWTLQIQHNEF